MENSTESVRMSLDGCDGQASPLNAAVRLFGPVRLELDGIPVQLPPSRKVRALLGILALSPRPVLRSYLCDLLWDVANDPRSELRWCISKLRGVIDQPDRRRVITDGQWVGLDLSDFEVDAIRLQASTEKAVATGSCDALRQLIALSEAELLEGLEARLPSRFQRWLIAMRQEFAALRGRALTALAALLPPGSPERLWALQRYLDIVPFDDDTHVELLTAFARSRSLEAGEQHLAAAVSAYRRDGIDPSVLMTAWARVRRGAASGAVVNRGTERCPQEATALNPVRTRVRLLVMPFADVSRNRLTADGLVRDIAVGLARLRSMDVIAPESAFALRDRGVDALDAARIVDADYVITGRLTTRSGEQRLAVELVRRENIVLVWADNRRLLKRDAHEVPAMVTEELISRLAAEIELFECGQAIVKPPAALDAWEAHHRGLWHLHRFTPTHNNAAQRFFEQSIALDPGFSRAYAGLSYAHWMNAFAFRPGEKAAERDRAYEAAGAGLHADPEDPAVLWSMSRALWMRHDETEALRAISRAIELSPSFALARHSRSFVDCQTGDPAQAIVESRVAQNLSPFDPWRYAMHGVEALGFVRLGKFKEAAAAAHRLTSKPNAHVQARGLAALVLAVSGDTRAAREEIAVVRRLQPRYSLRDFLSAYHVMEPLRASIERAAQEVGIA